MKTRQPESQRRAINLNELPFPDNMSNIPKNKAIKNKVKSIATDQTKPFLNHKPSSKIEIFKESANVIVTIKKEMKIEDV